MIAMGNRAAEIHAARRRQYFVRGVAFAVASGICYGLYTGFLTLAETQGVWGEWFGGGAWGGGHPALSAFVVSFALAALAGGLNDFFSGVWSLVVCAKNRQLGDLRKTMMTKPGRIMMLCAALGGPLATTAYIAGLNAATAAGNPGVIVPIAALNCAIGAVLGRVLFKQELGAHKVVGIVVCLVAGGLIGGASFAAIGPEALIACVFALIAAFGWGFEGCVAGFGTILIDYRIGIAIRQTTAGVLELIVMFPLLTLLGGEAANLGGIAAAALTSPALPIFALSGFFAMPAYSFWYKGNSMCGAALGMACNGMYAFWGPFFIWVIMGVLNLGGMAADYPPLAPVQWVGALIMVAGIFCIAVNPVELVRGRSGQNDDTGIRDTQGGASHDARGLTSSDAGDSDAGALIGLDANERLELTDTGSSRELKVKEPKPSGAIGSGQAGASEAGAIGSGQAGAAGAGQADVGEAGAGQASAVGSGQAGAARAGQTSAAGAGQAGAAGAGQAGAAGAGQVGSKEASNRRSDLIPLYYAIMKHFVDGGQYCTADVMAALDSLYGGYKLLTRKDVDEALATAKENGLLDESGYNLDEAGELRIFYQVNDFGADMIERYIGKYGNLA